MRISEMYGLEIITNTGKRIGSVEDVMLDFEKGGVHSLLLKKIEEITKAQPRGTMVLSKNSVNYTRVKRVSDTTIIVGME